MNFKNLRREKVNNKGLIISICIFMIVGMCALLLILNKGHIGTIGLVKLEEDSVEESSVFKIETKSKYLSSKDKEKTDIIATIDGVILKEQVEYVSSDENIAKIVDGNLVAVKDGKVTITANYNGKTASTQVHVITPIKNINFRTTSKSIRVGKELQMKL